MVDECHVLLPASNMVAPDEWVRAIRAEGFCLELDTRYDPTEEEGVFGYRPCLCLGREVGFELSYARRADDPEWFSEWDGQWPEASQYDFCVSLGLRHEGDAVLVAGAVLAKITGGVYFAVDLPLSTDEAMAAAREADARLRQ